MLIDLILNLYALAMAIAVAFLGAVAVHAVPTVEVP